MNILEVRQGDSNPMNLQAEAPVSVQGYTATSPIVAAHHAARQRRVQKKEVVVSR
jgi:hypothetical protein